jgi:uncharacterized protein (UPF0548 family)
MIRNPNKAMFSLIKPSHKKIIEFLHSQEGKHFTYPEVGFTKSGPLLPDHQLSKHYRLVHHRFHLGQGEKLYENAKAAFLRWDMFSLGWVSVHQPNTPMVPESLVAIVSHVIGVWSINVCRIIYILDDDGEIVRFGFGYGTLPGHAIRGEERMTVEFNRKSGAVHFEISSFSTESQLIAKISSFHLRSLQDRFAREAGSRMRHFACC